MDLCIRTGILLLICRRKWNVDLWFLFIRRGRYSSIRSKSRIFWYARSNACSSCDHSSHGNNWGNTRSGRTGIIIYLSSKPDQFHAWKYRDRDHLFRCSPFCRNDIIDQSLRSTDRNSAGETSRRKKDCLRDHCSDWCDRIFIDPGNRIWLDGYSIHLHLPIRSGACRNHVLLGSRKEICRNTGKQGKRK